MKNKRCLMVGVVAATLLLGGCSLLFPEDPAILPTPDRSDDPLEARLEEVYPEGYSFIGQNGQDVLELDLNGDGQNQKLAAFVSRVQGHVGVAVETQTDVYELVGFSMDSEDTGLRIEVLDLRGDGRQQFSMLLTEPEISGGRYLVYEYREGRLRRALSTTVTDVQVVSLSGEPGSELVLFSSVGDTNGEVRIYRDRGEGLGQVAHLTIPWGQAIDAREAILLEGKTGLLVEVAAPGDRFFSDVLVYDDGSYDWVMKTIRETYGRAGGWFPLKPGRTDNHGRTLFPVILAETDVGAARPLLQVQWSRWMLSGGLLPVEETFELVLNEETVRFTVPERWQGRLRIQLNEELAGRTLGAADVYLTGEDEPVHLFTFAVDRSLPEGLQDVLQGDELTIGVRIFRARADSVRDGFTVERP